MGHILMPSFAFRRALSEDSGVRSGFALNEAERLAHLPAGHRLRGGLVSDIAMRVGSDDYADTVGDLLFALGATEAPGMPTLGMRIATMLGPEWRSLLSIAELLKVEAVASHYLRLRTRGDDEQAAILAELKTMVDGKPGILEAIVEAMPYQPPSIPFSPAKYRRPT